MADGMAAHRATCGTDCGTDNGRGQGGDPQLLRGLVATGKKNSTSEISGSYRQREIWLFPNFNRLPDGRVPLKSRAGKATETWLWVNRSASVRRASMRSLMLINQNTNLRHYP